MGSSSAYAGVAKASFGLGERGDALNWPPSPPRIRLNPEYSKLHCAVGCKNGGQNARQPGENDG
jgi:hypothetical protein